MSGCQRPPLRPDLCPAVRRLGPGDADVIRAMNAMFGEAFAEPRTYGAGWPEEDWIERLLAFPHVVAMVAEADGTVVGGLVAYVLPKFEQRRSEIYVYDLAVAASHRRQGIATALLKALAPVADAEQAHAVFVQADSMDAAAIALYDRLGRREEVLHFDLDLRDPPATARQGTG